MLELTDDEAAIFAAIYAQLLPLYAPYWNLLPLYAPFVRYRQKGDANDHTLSRRTPADSREDAAPPDRARVSGALVL